MAAMAAINVWNLRWPISTAASTPWFSRRVIRPISACFRHWRGGTTICSSMPIHTQAFMTARLGHAQVTRFRHNDPDDLHKRLRRLADQPGDKVVVVEGIYSMLGDTAPLREFAQVKREWGAYLVVDEAHSMGVLGDTGRGLAEAEDVEADVDFVVGTFSKSLGGVGGFCVSDIEGFDILRVACRPYMFTASLPPAVIAATMEALHQLRTRPQLRERLMENAERFYAGLTRLGFRVGPELSPVV